MPPAVSYLIVPAPMPHRQPLDTLALHPRPLPPAQARPAVQNDGIPHHGSLLGLQLATEQQPHRGPGSGGVDDGVPEAHQGDRDGGAVAEGEGDERRVDDGIDSVH